MPLSEEELRLLEQMERALVEEDPKFASTLRGTSLRSVARRRAILAGVVFVVGVAVMMTGVVMQIIPVGIVGFLIMLASATLGLSVVRGQHGAPPAPADEAEPSTKSGFTVIQGGKKQGRRPRSNTSGSFLERMEERWRRRREGGGF
ncbi:DUF3040 domain-containing protein [Nocardioides coralli]|uniref:DUF3040 domain-containing protein n=1 Tax=Nocardioides coralli TaxID=2872154 RepID=UPI001CA3AA2D|nr:DUF3040 domain-containing protein [Nocardioides coralli]QZY27971.1 DUF3040 domain-containing protein [Nocardioides coralli]